jgi:hypothetical protein
MIGVVSDCAVFRKAVKRLLQIGRWGDVLVMPSDLAQIQSRVVPSAPMILDAHIADASGTGKGGLTLIRRLRSDQTWRYVGPVLVLAYEPEAHLGQWQDAEVLETKSITVLRMPFAVADFQAILASAAVLSEAEWDEISCRLGPKSVADRAAKLGHDYENALWQVLAALRELEKLSGSLAPDFQKVKHEIGIIRGRLTEERLSNFSTALTTLHAEADRLGLIDETCARDKLDAHIAQVRQWLALFNLDERAVKFGDIFRAAHESRLALRELLNFFRVIKEKATKEVKGGS